MREQATEKHDVSIRAGRLLLEGNLSLPSNSNSLVLFAHGSGSNRFSSRNVFVADALNQAGIGTLLFDLLSVEEEAVDRYTARLRFDIGLLAERLIAATAFVLQQQETARTRIGYFGASTGAAAALLAAAELPRTVQAVVSRGGRPDLAASALSAVESPTLLIVGENDVPVIEMNEEAMHQMRCEAKMEIVPGATHLFEEPGTLEQVANLATQWFKTYLQPGRAGQAATA